MYQHKLKDTRHGGLQQGRKVRTMSPREGCIPQARKGPRVEMDWLTGNVPLSLTHLGLQHEAGLLKARVL